MTRWLQGSAFTAEFLDSSLKGFLILSVAALVCFTWRRAAASARHLVWFLAIAGVFCLPGLSRLLPSWERPLWAVGTRADSLNELTLTLEFAATGSSLPHVEEPQTHSPAATPAASEVTQEAKGQRLSTHFHTGWAVAGLALWLSGTVVILLSTAIGRVRLRMLRLAAQPANEPWHELLRQVRGNLQLRRRVTLLQSRENLMPMTWGWWKPVILLPAEAEEWSMERRRIVLLHELAHVKRWDCLTQLITRLACAVYWFNPLVWVAARRMGIERERACDDLVLSGGCKPSDYAGHLVEIARAFRRVPQVAAIAMARPSGLEGRIAAIVDPSRARRAPRGVLLAVCGVGVVGFVAAIAAPQVEANNSALASRPWFDARLSAFFASKAAQARALADGEAVAPEVWPYFEAGMKQDWNTATNLGEKIGRAHRSEGTARDKMLDKVWGPILETRLAWEVFRHWTEKYVLAYGNDIIQSIPRGSIYFGGTDPGRGVITAMSESHAEGEPFYTLTQNALADGMYLQYLRTMYGQALRVPGVDDSQKCFTEYLSDVQRRLQANQLKPGEDVTAKEGKVMITGQVVVMQINALLAKLIFDRNPEREIYVEESFPLEWMYPHLTPNGLIMKVNREPLAGLSESVVQQDHEYWARYLKPMLGGWLKEDTSVADVVAFAEKVYLNHDSSGFTGDVQFVEDVAAQKAYAKLRSSLGGLYFWRMRNAKTAAEKQRMTKAADFAFRQAFALCPHSPEGLFRYVDLLLTSNRREDAILLAETTLKLDPENTQVKDLLSTLKRMPYK